MPGRQIRKQKRRIADEIMNLTRNELIVQMPFFNRALLKMDLMLYERMHLEEVQLFGFGTDGMWLYCYIDRVLELFQTDKKELDRIYMHMIFHCMFNHLYQYRSMRMEDWDAACDIAVEAAILQMGKKEFATEGDEKRRQVIDALAAACGRMTAENIYHHMGRNEEVYHMVHENSALFYRDIHRFWIPVDEDEIRRPFPQNPHPGMDKISDEWKKISTSVNLDVQVFEKNQGLNAGTLLLNLGEIKKNRYDYKEFLKKFAIMNEEVRINHEEFDYIYYTYGMDLYGNLPLIEPLEYRETKRIRDFVIAIDTSGSCQGSTVETFLKKTYEILNNTQSFFDKVNIHIIQCDSEIQSDVQITSKWEFEEYMKDIKVAGFGGTDFRPVFRYVDEMIKNRKFTDLKGLIYFTDGKGIFPERMPEYQTAFIFLDDGFDIPKFPPWAVKLILREEDITQTDAFDFAGP